MKLWTKTKANRIVMLISANETGGEELIVEILLAVKKSLPTIKSTIQFDENHRKYNKNKTN